MPLTRISRPPLRQDGTQRGPGSLAPSCHPTLLAGCKCTRSSPPEADTGLGCNKLGVGSVVEGAGEQQALGLAKDHSDHCISWASLGHGVAHNGLRTHRLLAAGWGAVWHLGFEPWPGQPARDPLCLPHQGQRPPTTTVCQGTRARREHPSWQRPAGSRSHLHRAGLAAHKGADVASCLEALSVDGELGSPCLGAPLGTQAQQDRVLGNKASQGRHSHLAWHFLTLAPVPKPCAPLPCPTRGCSGPLPVSPCPQPQL